VLVLAAAIVLGLALHAKLGSQMSSASATPLRDALPAAAVGEARVPSAPAPANPAVTASLAPPAAVPPATVAIATPPIPTPAAKVPSVQSPPVVAAGATVAASEGGAVARRQVVRPRAAPAPRPAAAEPGERESLEDLIDDRR
jgi:hypothetical protein